MFSPAITSAPSFTSPSITRLPSNSTFCPDLTEPLWNFVSDVAISLQYVFVIPCSPNVLGLSNFIFTSKCFFINSCISSISLFFSTFPVITIGVFSLWYNFFNSGIFFLSEYIISSCEKSSFIFITMSSFFRFIVMQLFIFTSSFILVFALSILALSDVHF